MERNDTGNTTGSPGGQGDANEFSGNGSAQPQDGGFDFAGTAGTNDQALADRAKNAIGSAGDKLADVGSTVRDRAGNAKNKLADVLESGAERLRDRTQNSAGATLAGATADGSTAIQGDAKIAQLSDRVAGGMEKSADWLREADIDGLKMGIENQVKEHPARTLLIAAGLGYLLGRAFRGNQ